MKHPCFGCFTFIFFHFEHYNVHDGGVILYALVGMATSNRSVSPLNFVISGKCSCEIRFPPLLFPITESTMKYTVDLCNQLVIR